jgi:hypothetical protein
MVTDATRIKKTKVRLKASPFERALLFINTPYVFFQG